MAWGDALGMIESLLLLGLLASMAAIAWVPWLSLLVAGAALATLGLLVGVPAGLLYHLRLRAALLALEALPPRWWLEPVRLHARLDAASLARVRPSFYVGAGGFALCALGCLLGALALPGALGWR